MYGAGPTRAVPPPPVRQIVLTQPIPKRKGLPRTIQAKSLGDIVAHVDLSNRRPKLNRLSDPTSQSPTCTVGEKKKDYAFQLQESIKENKKAYLIACGIFLAMVLALSIGLGLGLRDSNDDDDTDYYYSRNFRCDQPSTSPEDYASQTDYLELVALYEIEYYSMSPFGFSLTDEAMFEVEGDENLKAFYEPHFYKALKEALKAMGLGEDELDNEDAGYFAELIVVRIHEIHKGVKKVKRTVDEGTLINTRIDKVEFLWSFIHGFMKREFTQKTKKERNRIVLSKDQFNGIYEYHQNAALQNLIISYAYYYEGFVPLGFPVNTTRDVFMFKTVTEVMEILNISHNVTEGEVFDTLFNGIFEDYKEKAGTLEGISFFFSLFYAQKSTLKIRKRHDPIRVDQFHSRR